jgi:hypothetical protein
MDGPSKTGSHAPQARGPYAAGELGGMAERLIAPVLTRSSGTIGRERSEPEGRGPWMGRAKPAAMRRRRAAHMLQENWEGWQSG